MFVPIDDPWLMLCGLPADFRRYSNELSSLVNDIRDFGCSDRRAAKQPGKPSPKMQIKVYINVYTI